MNDGGMDLAPSINVTQVPGQIIIDPEAEAVKLLGVSAYADINWTPNWTSAIGYSFTKVDNTNFQEAEASRRANTPRRTCSTSGTTSSPAWNSCGASGPITMATRATI